MTLRPNNRPALGSNGHRVLAIAVAAGAAAVPASSQGPRATPDVIARAVDSLARRIVSSGVTPALGVAVVMDGKTILANGYGWADATARIAASDRTLWYLASTSKSYTGFGISLLALRAGGRRERADRLAPARREVARRRRCQPPNAAGVPLAHASHRRQCRRAERRVHRRISRGRLASIDPVRDPRVRPTIWCTATSGTTSRPW